MIGNGVVVYCHIEQAALQKRKKPGELQQFGESPFQGISSLGEGTPQQVPEGLILQAREESLAGLVQRTSISSCPNQDGTEHPAGASKSASEAKHPLTGF
jgi:hypothetical protein